MYVDDSKIMSYNLAINSTDFSVIASAVDSVVFPKSEEQEVMKLLENEMKNACKLIVPLEIDVTSSFRWSEGH